MPFLRENIDRAIVVTQHDLRGFVDPMGFRWKKGEYSMTITVQQMRPDHATWLRKWAPCATRHSPRTRINTAQQNINALRQGVQRSRVTVTSTSR